jgi:hypothetical protein
VNIGLELLFLIVGGVLGIAGFWISQKTSAIKHGSSWGEMQSDIRHIKQTFDKFETRFERLMSEISSETKESIRRCHSRIEDLIKDHVDRYHS